MDIQNDALSLVTPGFVGAHQLVAYGAGLSLLQMQSVGHNFVYAVDDTPGLFGQRVGGVPVFPVSRLKELDTETTMVVICANRPHSILAMASHLNSLGLVWGKHYVDCPVLQFESMRPRIRRELSIDGSRERFSFVRLLSLYSSVTNLSYAAGTWLLVELLEHCGQTSRGAIAECGVYSGGNAFITLMASETARNRRYYLLDSFEGFASPSQADPPSKMGDSRDTSVGPILDMFQNFRNDRVLKGYFNQTVSTIRDEEFLMVLRRL